MKTRLHLVTVTLVGLACMRPLTVPAAQTNAASLIGSVVQGFAGRTVNVPWSLRHTGAVSGVQFDLSYPPDKLIAGDFQAGTLPDNVAFRSRQLATGQQRVLFYAKDGSVLGTNFFIGNLPTMVAPGDYSGGGRITISNAIVSRTDAVAAAPVALSHGGVITTPLFRGADGVVDLLIVVQSNHLWAVQATTNFVNWENIATNFATFDYVTATDEDAPNFPLRFYRALLVDSAAGAGGQINGLSLLPGNQLTFGYATTSGHTYIIQTSTNLTSWDALATNLADSSPLNFTNIIAPTIPRQFFRILELP